MEINLLSYPEVISEVEEAFIVGSAAMKTQESVTLSNDEINSGPISESAEDLATPFANGQNPGFNTSAPRHYHKITGHLSATMPGCSSTGEREQLSQLVTYTPGIPGSGHAAGSHSRLLSIRSRIRR